MLTVALALAAATAAWQPVDGIKGFKLFQRETGETSRELLATAIIDAPPYVVKNAVDDFEAKKGRMPFVAEVKVLARDESGALVYNRTSAPLVADRDFTLHITDDSFVRPDGETVYVQRWQLANDQGPKLKPGVVRVSRSEGYWRFEPVDGGAKTKATYFLAAQAEGIPKQIADWATSQVFTGMFSAVRDRIVDAKYRGSPPIVTARRD